MAKKWWVLASVACGTFMATLDSSIVNIALPTLTKDLASNLYQVKWVVIAYLLTITCLVLPFGRLADIYGRKPIFELGFSIFTLGSAFCGISPTLLALVLARAVQAIGASMLMANGPALITASFPSFERGKALGIMAMVVSIGLISGPSVGGILISQLGWRSIFWVNVPIGLIGILLVYRNVATDLVPRTRPPFDWFGAGLQIFVMLSFMALFDPPAISFSGSAAFLLPRWAMGLIVLAFGTAFIKVESTVTAPLLDLSLLKNRTFSTANLASFFIFVSFSSVSVLMPFFLEEVLHQTPQTAGFYMTAIPLTILFVAPISGWMSDHVGSQGLSLSGAFIGATALLAMGGAFGRGMYESMSQPLVVMSLASIGLATGLFQSPNNNAIMSAVPHAKLGVASAMLATVRNLGLVTGTGLSTGLFSWRLALTHDFVSSLHFSFFVAGLTAVCATLAGIAKGWRPHPAQSGPVLVSPERPASEGERRPGP